MRIFRFFLISAILVLFFTQAATAKSGLPDFTEMAQKAGQAVVNISTVKVVETSKRLKRFFDPFHDKNAPFNEFFERFFGEMPKKRKEHALGSGFIISKDGYIVSNNHVIEEAEEIKVTLQGGEESYTAEVIGRDPETDLALLKIEADKSLPVLEFGKSEEIEVGQWVLAIGNPFGLDHTVTAGIISAKGRVIGAGPYDNFLQTDASINPGNSGGPLLSLQGEVIGINTAIVASGQGIGFAIPSDMAKDVISQLKKYKKVKRGWLGVTIQDVDQNAAKALGLSEAKGALVASVKEGDPADKAGIEVGDVIVSVEDQPVQDAGELTRLIGRMSPKDEIMLTVWRNGKLKEINVTLGERSMQMAQTRQEDQYKSEDSLFLGMKLKPVDKEIAEHLGLKSSNGLAVLGVEPGSAAASANIAKGDVIIKANGKQVNDLATFEKILEEDARPKGVMMVYIKRRGQSFFRTIAVDEKEN